jgi:PAS domain S-box-containing protein
MKKPLNTKIVEKLFNNASTTLFIWNNDENWSVKYVSKNVSKIFGYKAKDFLKKRITYEECIHKDFLKEVKDELTFYSKNKNEFFEHKPYKIITKNQEEKWVVDQTVIDRNKKGKITQYIGYISDVTELMNLNIENQKLEKKVSVVLDSIKDGIWEWNLQTGETFFSKQWKNMLGYEEDEIKNTAQTFFDLVHKDDKQRVENELQKHFDAKNDIYSIKLRLRTKDGNYMWILARGKVVYDKNGKPKEMVGSHVDISHLREVEEKLRESENRWKFALEGSGDGIWDWNIETGEVYFSKQWKEMLGYKEDEIGSSLQAWIDLVHPNQLKKITKDIQNYLDGKSKRYITEHQVLCKDGTYKWILDRGMSIQKDKDGKPIRMIGTHTDIDKTKKYQEQIDLLNERFTSMFENHDAIMLLISPEDGQIIDANKSAQKFYGYSAKEFVKLNIDEINTLPQELVAKKIDEAKSNLNNNFILEHKKKNGEIVIIETRTSPIKTENGTVLFSIIEDVTKEVENEKKLTKVLEQLQEAQKIAKLGIWETDVATLNIEWSNEVYNIFEKDKNNFSPTYESFMNMVHPYDREAVSLAYENSLKTKEAYDITHRILLKDGRIKYVREQCDTHFDKDGKPITSYGTVQDVTELTSLNLKINQEKNRYKSLLDLSSDGVLIVNKSNELIEYSQVAKEMLGYSDKEMQNLKISDWDIKYKDEELEKLLSKISQESTTFETIHKRKDGSTYNASITAVTIDIEDEELIYAAVRDITDEHELQKQIMYEKNFVSSIIDSANAVVAVIDSNGVMIKLNSYAQEFSGYTQEEISSEPYKWKTLLPLEVQDRVIGIVENAKHGNIIKSHQNVWVSKNGEERMFEWSNTLVKKDDGSMDYLATIGIDVTQKEEHKKIFETIFNTSKDGLAILDLNSKFLEFNRAYIEMTGFSREELLSKTCVEMSVDEDKLKAKKIIKQVFKNGHVDNFEKTCVVKDGKQIVVNMSIALMPDKKSILVNTKDVTLKKLQQDELKRTKELAEKANKSKSEFLANMSHEIRTPLNGMIGLTKLTLETELNDIQKEYLQKSLNSSKILLSVISDILDYSKIEANKIDICKDEFYLDNMMQNLSDMFSYQAYEKGIDYIFTIDPKIPNILVGDQVRLTQILTNLIGNSIKFTQKGHVNVHLELKNGDEKNVIIECLVQDTGIGISKEKQKKLFRAFEQGDSSTTKKFGGTGLGLMISKKLVELMGSEIWLKSDIDKGSTLGFSLKLPYVKDKNIHDEKISKFQKTSFLFVDDNKIEREYMSNIFTSWGIDLQTAEDGEDAYNKIKNKDFDYVMIDWKMPKLDGLELLQKLQQEDIMVDNILLVTAHNKEALLSKAQKDGVFINKVLTKPYTPSSLYEILFSEKYQNLKTQDNARKKFKLTKAQKALLVEDNETNQLVATKLLQNIGFVVDVANDGQEALDKVKVNSYDIVFMDIHMPVMNGYTSSLRIREFDTKTPIIALSAAVMKQDKDLSIESKMDGHLSKPIDSFEVEKLLQKYFDIAYIQEEESKKTLELNINGIDIIGLQNDLSCDTHTIYGYYKNFYKNYINEIRESLKYDKTSQEMKNFIHKLKGTSGNLKISTIYQLCVKYEEDISSETIFRKLFLELEYILKEIETKIIPLTNLKIQNFTIQDIQDFISSVVEKLESYELVTYDDIDKIILGLEDKISRDNLEKIQKYYLDNETDLLCKLLKDIKEDIHD